MGRTSLWIALVCCLSVTSAFAQTQDVQQLQDRIQQLEQITQELKDRLAALERSQPGTPAGSQASEAQPSVPHVVNAVYTTGSQTTASLAQPQSAGTVDGKAAAASRLGDASPPAAQPNG